MPRSDYFIPVYDELPGHRKERANRRAMGWNGFESVGFLVWFWRQVAADFQEGELPELEALEATLREVWKAADIEPKRKTIQLVARSLLESGFVDRDEETGAIYIHDWEDGAGMFAVKRQFERDRKRRQREAKRKNVPGTGEECPIDVPGEIEKEKEKETPPNPPQAGGDFKFFEKTVFRLWKGELVRMSRQFTDDPKTVLGAGKLAKWLMEHSGGEEDLRLAMRAFLDGVEKDSGKASWTLNTLANSLANYLPKKKPQQDQARGGGGALVMWELRCDVCGKTAATPYLPAGAAVPPQPCINSANGCQGTMHPAESWERKA